jgi:hypothetical protein
MANDDRQNARSDGDGAPADVRHGGNYAGAALVHHTLTGLLVTGALAIGVWLILAPPSIPGLTADPGATKASQPTPLAAARTHSRRLRIHTAAEVFALEEQSPPSALPMLVERELLRDTDLYYAPGRAEWNYSAGTDDFTLSPPEETTASTDGE